jgi:hypothetical protein
MYARTLSEKRSTNASQSPSIDGVERGPCLQCVRLLVIFLPFLP